jgi:hypothetical protein
MSCFALLRQKMVHPLPPCFFFPTGFGIANEEIGDKADLPARH